MLGRVSGYAAAGLWFKVSRDDRNTVPLTTIKKLSSPCGVTALPSARR